MIDALVTMTMEELEQHEAVIRTGLATFFQVGLALHAIQEQHGYRLRGYPTFDEYMEKQWHRSRQHGYQLIDQAQVVQVLSGGTEGECQTVFDISGRAALELARLKVAPGDDDEDRRVKKLDVAAVQQAFRVAVAFHGDRPTAAVVRQVVTVRQALGPVEDAVLLAAVTQAETRQALDAVSDQDPPVVIQQGLSVLRSEKQATDLHEVPATALRDELRRRQDDLRQRRALQADPDPAARVGVAERRDLVRVHLAQRGRLSSLVSYLNRGPWGDNTFRGNCSGYLVVDLLDWLKARSVLDPMEGSGTTREVCADLGITYAGYDLYHGAGTDVVEVELPGQYDLVFLHPPYWNIIEYGPHPADLSRLDYGAYITALTALIRKLRHHNLTTDGHLALLIADVRKSGRLYPLAATLMGQIGQDGLTAWLIKAQHHQASAGWYYSGAGFVPITHEHVLVWRR